MIENNRIIIVDNEKEELNQLRDVFYKHGIGCKGFLYDGFEFPEAPLTGVRFAFFDIKLSQSADANSILKDAISKYISTENGPFILVFWTKVTEEIAAFKDFINRTDDSFRQKIKPILVTSVDKVEFLSAESDLDAKIQEILSSDLVKCIFKFDESVLEAATKTLNAIISTINVSDNWGEQTNFDKACRLVFSKIAESTFGLAQAKLEPDLALKESLAPIFKHLLCQNQDDYWKEYLTPLQNANHSTDISFPDGFSLEKLNSIYHIDTARMEHKRISDRGAVCTFAQHDKEEVFNSLFHVHYQAWLSDSFKKLSDVDSSNIQLIAVEFSAACDFSQNKDRTNKYILGIMVPSCYGKKLRHEKLKEQIFLLPFDFCYNNENYTIALNLNYTFNLPKTPNVLNGPVFVLSKESMDMLGLQYSSHISRIGITSFRKK